ncbi:MAG: carbohydrate ABC transporter permease [Candidatus Sericytochromatia bacterium]|nr:carbohydrate ABC transporter permease [Candidatus Tanganyikabacteria bacterium]
MTVRKAWPLYLLLVGCTALAVIPFLWMLVTAFKTGPEVFRWPPALLPETWTLDNFGKAWGTGNFPRLFLNSLIVASAATLLNVVLDSLAGFAFARLRFPGRDALFAVVLGTMMLPAVVTLIPLFLIVKQLPAFGPGGWLNTYAGIVAPGAASAFGIFLFRQYFQTIPREIDEAAQIDGASLWRVYWQLVLPLARPAVVTVAIFTFTLSWNDFLWPLVVATDADMYTVQVGLSYFTTQHSIDWPLLMAGAVIVTLPVLVLYFALQKAFIGGVTLGGVKE